jgi:hypothetical protein
MKYSIHNQIKNRNKLGRFKMDFKFLLFFTLIMVSFNAIRQNANSEGKNSVNSDDNHIFKTIL